MFKDNKVNSFGLLFISDKSMHKKKQVVKAEKDIVVQRIFSRIDTFLQ